VNLQHSSLSKTLLDFAQQFGLHFELASSGELTRLTHYILSMKGLGLYLPWQVLGLSDTGRRRNYCAVIVRDQGGGERSEKGVFIYIRATVSGMAEVKELCGPIKHELLALQINYLLQQGQ